MKAIFILIAMLSTALPAVEKPNIVWVVSEDNSAHWLGLYEKGGVEMPTIEKLAESGLVFNNAFSCAPVCSVARSTIISGCYAPRVGAQYHRRERFALMPEGLKMFPWYLKQAGYYTTNCAKEDYNFNHSEKTGVWDESSYKASYRKRKKGQPFFHVQNFHTTHEGRLHFKDMSGEVSDDPETLKVMDYHPNTPLFRFTYATYRERHRDVDKQIGAFIDGLKKDGLLDNTFIFYYGDHGGALPRGKGYAYNNGLQVPMVVYIPEKWKHLVPAERGSRIDGFVQFIDLGPTVLNLAGIEVPKQMDGKPFLGKGVELKELNSRDTNFGYADRFDEKYDLVRTIRKAKYNYMRNYQGFNYDGLYNEYRYKQLAYAQWFKLYKEGKLNKAQSQFFEARPPEALYDLEKDPHEVNNLANDPAYSEVLADMRRLMREKVTSLPDLSFIPEPVMINEGKEDFYSYGQKKKADIAQLIKIADLSLKSFPEAKNDIKNALNSPKPMERYWGLIVCSNFGNKADTFFAKAKEIAKTDGDPLVRTRAAEFLALTGAMDTSVLLVEILGSTDDTYTQGLILNSLALLKDGPPGYKFDLSKLISSGKWKDEKLADPTARRIKYLTGIDFGKKKKPKKKKPKK